MLSSSEPDVLVKDTLTCYAMCECFQGYALSSDLCACSKASLGFFSEIANHQPRLDIADHKVDDLMVCTLDVLRHMAFRGKLQQGRDQELGTVTGF